MSMSRKDMELRLKELLDAEGILIKRITQLESLLRECVDALDWYHEHAELVLRARALMAGPALEPEPIDQRGASVAVALAGTFTGAPIPSPAMPEFARHRPPYPMCRTPGICAGAGYCKRDPACND